MKDKKGIFVACPTPFTDTGELDLGSLTRLVDFHLEAGVHGLAVLSTQSEVHKLTSFERRRVIETAVFRSQGAVPIWSGIRMPGLAGVIEQARAAESLGVDGVLVGPLRNTTSTELLEYYKSIVRVLRIPVIIHDAPAIFGAELPPEIITDLNQNALVRSMVTEHTPIGHKITSVDNLTGGNMTVFVGPGSLFFLEELGRGAAGVMTGFAFPEVLLHIYKLFSMGHAQEASSVFNRYCPLLRYDLPSKIRLTLCKHFYMKRGIIASDYVRIPSNRIDAITQRELDDAVDSVGLSWASAQKTSIL